MLQKKKVYMRKNKNKRIQDKKLISNPLSVFIYSTAYNIKLVLRLVSVSIESLLYFYSAL